MKISVWLVTRERSTWIGAAEVLGLAVLLTAAVDSALARLFGFFLLAHLGYSALTGLPMGSIPGRPAGGRRRRNLDLRAKVAGFLRQVRRLEEYVQRARLAGWSAAQVERNLAVAERRMLTAAADVAKVARRTALEPPDTDDLPEHRASTRPISIHAPTVPESAA